MRSFKKNTLIAAMSAALALTAGSSMAGDKIVKPAEVQAINVQQSNVSEHINMIRGSSSLQSADSVWLLTYADATDKKIVEVFGGPKPSIAATKTSSTKIGEGEAPTADDFSDPTGWVNLPDNGTVTWSGNVESENYNWSVTATWEHTESGPSGGGGGWLIINFSTTNEGEKEEPEPPAPPQPE